MVSSVKDLSSELPPCTILCLSVIPYSELSGLIRLIKVGVWIEGVKEHPSVLDLLLLQWRPRPGIRGWLSPFSLLAADRSADEVIMN